MRKKKLLLIIAVLLVAGCDNSNKTVAKNDAPVHVDVTTLRSQNVTLSTQLPGRTASVRTAEVRPQVDGIILKRQFLSLIHISEPTRRLRGSRMPSSA